MKYIISILLFTIFISCNQYSDSVCTRSNLSSVPDFEGNYYMEILGEKTGLEVTQLGLGKYKLIQSDTPAVLVSTCKINGDLYMELPVEDSSSFQLGKIEVTKENFIMSVQVFNKEKLDSLNIPYEIIDESAAIFYVDNSNVSAEDIARTLDLLYPVTYYRE